jgi:hypothetical protein
VVARAEPPLELDGRLSDLLEAPLHQDALPERLDEPHAPGAEADQSALRQLLQLIRVLPPLPLGGGGERMQSVSKQ